MSAGSGILQTFHRLRNTGVTPDVTEDRAKRVRLTNQYAFIFGSLTVFYGVLFRVLGFKELSIYISPFTLFFYLAIVLNHFGLHNLSRFLVNANSVVVVSLYAAAFSRNAGVHYWLMTAAQTPFVLFNLSELRKIVSCVAIVIAALLLLMLTDFNYGLLPPANASAEVEKILSFAMVSLSTLTTFSIVYFVALDYQHVSQKKLLADRTAQRLERALNESSIVAVTDTQGKIIHVNQKFTALTGYTFEEVFGRPHSMLSSGHHKKEFFSELWGTITKNKIWHGEICNRKKDGSIYWVDTTIVPMTNEGGSIENYVAIRHEITLQKAAEVSLIQAAKMATLGEMASGIAHEINNPLAIIHGKSKQLLRHLERGTFTPEMGTTQLHAINTTVERAAGIIQGLRTFSRDGHSDPFYPEPVSKILKEARALCEAKFAHHQIRLDWKDEADTTQLKCRKVQISQVLLNLLNNAFDAVVTQPEKWVKVELKVDEKFLKLSVTDSGKGIDPSIAPRLMEPFFSTKQVGQGTGLGLSISKGIIEDHGGKLCLNVESPHTQFVIELPLAQGPA